MVINRQTKVRLNTREVRAFVRRLTAVLRLKGQPLNLCFVNDDEIQRLNARFRGKPKPTDVLSFPWKDSRPPQWQGAVPGVEGREGRGGDELAGFLGDIVISAETAQHNAVSAGHSTRNEIRWLILHGVLHLLGYDHETDDGQMTRVELSLRNRLGIDRAGGEARAKKRTVDCIRHTGNAGRQVPI